MKNLKNKRTVILIIILVALLLVAYKVVLVGPTLDEEVGGISDETSSNDAWESVLSEVEGINFDTNITQNQKFQSLKSIETPIISLPVGRRNPFSDISSSN